LQQITDGTETAPQHQRRYGVAQIFYAFDLDPALTRSIEPRLAEMSIERAGQIGQQHRNQAKRFNNFSQRFLIARRHPGGAKQVDFAPLPSPLPHRGEGTRTAGLRGDELIDQAIQRFGKALLKAATKIGRARPHDAGLGILRILGAERFDDARHISALRFSQTRSRHADQCGLLFARQQRQRFNEVVIGVHHGGDVIHRRGLQRNRLAEMPYEIDLGKGAAALRAMQKRNCTIHTQISQRRAHKGTGLERINRQRFADFFNRGHHTPSHGALLRTAPQIGL